MGLNALPANEPNIPRTILRMNVYSYEDVYELFDSL